MLRPSNLILALIAALAIVQPFASGAPTSTTVATSTSVEAAKKADTLATEGVKAAEASLTAARATKTAAGEALAAAEGKPEEPPPTEEPAAVVSSSPAGVPGSWQPVYVDAFGAQLGTGPGQDNTIHVEERGTARGCCGNSTEQAYERAAQVHVTPAGLELACKFIGGTGLQYECGGVSGDTAPHPFEVTLAGPQSIAVDCYCKWPKDEGGADPGFWWYTSSVEVDFFEGWGYGSSALLTWATANAGMPVVTNPYHEHTVSPVTSLGFDPSTGLHHYTTVFTPASGGTLVSEYVDGVFRWSFTDSFAGTSDGLLLTNALRVHGGTSPFIIRSVAVYEDTAHVGVGIKGGGVAPGTTVK